MKIVGQLVCGPNEKYLEETLKEFARLCDDVIVATCRADKKTLQLLDNYDIRHYEDKREWGVYQPDIKADLLRRIHQLNGDWILVLDADETVPSLTRKSLEDITVNRQTTQFYVVNLWNDIHHYSKALSFWNVRFYRSDPTRGVAFLQRPLHTGNAPKHFYLGAAKDTYVPHILLHKGLMSKESRLAKYKRYEKYDPSKIYKNNDWGEYYNALLDEHEGSEYNQSTVLKEIKQFCDGLY